MKKTRNSFFAESNTTYQGIEPNLMGPMPYQAGTNYNAYYMGSAMPNNDYESRFSKIERQINRLEYRINKLENNLTNQYIDDIDNSNNMYMI